MRLLIAGSRNFNFDITAIQNFIDILIPMDTVIDEVVSGACRGVDVSGQNWAEFQSYPVKKFKPDWDMHGKAAGPIRNRQMAEYADILLLVWDGKSKGSSNMRSEMAKLNKPIYEVILKQS